MCGEGHRAEKWVLVGDRAAALGRRRESTRQEVGGSQSHKDGGHLRLWRVGRTRGTGEPSSAETRRALSALMAPPHIASQKTQQEHARSGFSCGASILGFSPVRPFWTYHLQSSKVIKCATLSLYNQGHVLQKLQGSQAGAQLAPAEAGAE